MDSGLSSALRRECRGPLAVMELSVERDTLLKLENDLILVSEEYDRVNISFAFRSYRIISPTAFNKEKTVLFLV